MQSTSYNRRRFVQLAGKITLILSTSCLLAGCGESSSGDGSSGTSIVPATDASPPAPSDPATALSASAASLNLALNLEYLGAQFYAYTTTGGGLPAALISGIGAQGMVVGGRRASLSDPALVSFATEMAADKAIKVSVLRAQLSNAAAAQPMIDLSASANSAFSLAAQAAFLIQPGTGFDAFANDTNFLLAAFLLENIVAATYRSLARDVDAVTSPDAITANLATSIYHGGLIRTKLAEMDSEDPSVGSSLTALSAMLAHLDGSNLDAQSFDDVNGGNLSIVDADGRLIPLLRSHDQVLQLMYLSSVKQVGGFLPRGANGIA